MPGAVRTPSLPTSLVRKGYGYYPQKPPAARPAPPPPSLALGVPPALMQSVAQRGQAPPHRFGRAHSLAYALIRGHQNVDGQGWRTTNREIAQKWPGAPVTPRWAHLVVTDLVQAGWVVRENLLGLGVRVRVVQPTERKTRAM